MSIFSLFLCNAQENLSVSDAVKLTLENNLDIKITENQNEIFKNNASFLNSGYLPKLSTSAGFNKSKQNVEIETPNNLSGKLDNMKSENSFSNISLEYVLFDNNGRKFNYKKPKEIPIAKLTPIPPLLLFEDIETAIKVRIKDASGKLYLLCRVNK